MTPAVREASSRASDIHDRAMELDSRARLKKLEGHPAEARQLLLAAVEQAKQAAQVIRSGDVPEPSRSIILRSGATLAVDARDYATARLLIAQALTGQPPLDVRWDLGDLLDSLPIVDNPRFFSDKAPASPRELLAVA